MSTATLPALLERFFTERLIQQRQASAHTIACYRDAFRLLLKFAHGRLRKSPADLDLTDLDAPLISAFLNDLEHTRSISASDPQLAPHGGPLLLHVRLVPRARTLSSYSTRVGDSYQAAVTFPGELSHAAGDRSDPGDT